MTGRAAPAQEKSVVRPLLLGNEWVTSRAGGLNRYLAELLAALRLAECHATAVVVGHAPDDKHVLGVGSIDDPLPVRLLAIRRAAARMADSIDVVDAHFALYAFLPVFTTRLRRLPLVVHFHGPWAQESLVGRGDNRFIVAAKRAVERAVYRRAKVVVVLSDAFARVVTHDYGVDPGRVVVVPPGVDLVRFSPGDSDDARASFGVAPGAFLAVSVRRLDHRMGLDVLIKAWETVNNAKPEAVLLIAGEGRERDHLVALREQLPNPASVRLIGRVDDGELARLYQAADVSVVPTRALEGFGLVTLESLACGTPPIVTDVGGLPDGVRELDPSLIVPSEDPAALADRLIAAANGSLPTPAACRSHAERFSWDAVARRHIAIYNAAADRAPRRPKVVFLDHCAQLSGGEIALTRLIPALDVDAHVILAETGPLIARLQAAGATVEVLPLTERTRGLGRYEIKAGFATARSAAATAAYVLRLARRLRKLQPDVVHTNSLKSAVYGGLAARLAGVPVVWHVRDRISEDYLPRPVVRGIRVAATRVPDAIIANSYSTLDTLRLPGNRLGGNVVLDSVSMPTVVVPSAIFWPFRTTQHTTEPASTTPHHWHRRPARLLEGPTRLPRRLRPRVPHGERTCDRHRRQPVRRGRVRDRAARPSGTPRDP